VVAVSVAHDYLGLDEDDDVLELLFDEVDPMQVMLFGLLLVITTASSASMLVLIYVFKKELVMAGGFPVVMSFAQGGMVAAFACFAFAVGALIKEVMADEDVDEPAVSGGDD
jgi:hypothetical protein